MELETRPARALEAGADPTDAQFRLLVETVSDYAIYLLDTAGRVMSWNTGAERIKGYSAGGKLRRPFLALLSAGGPGRGPTRSHARARRKGRAHQCAGLACSKGRQPLLGGRGDHGFAQPLGRTDRLCKSDARSHHLAPGARADTRKRGAPAGFHRSQSGDDVPEGRRRALSLRQPPVPRPLRPAA